jgi:hypothetical protein
MATSTKPRTQPNASGPFLEAWQAANRVGVAQATDAQLMAAFCADNLQILVGAFSPQLVWEGAQKAGLTTRDLAKLCNDRNTRVIDDLQWS